MRNTKSNKGFTLIELLIVIAIIGILAAVLIPNLLGARTAAQTRAEEAYASQVFTAANAYLAENIEATTVETDCLQSGVNGYIAGNYSVGSFPATMTACEVATDGRSVTYSGLNGTDVTIGAPAPATPNP